MSNLDTVFKVPLSGGGLILPLSFPQALSTEFRVRWRGGWARAAWTGLRWSPGPMNSFFTFPFGPFPFPFTGAWVLPLSHPKSAFHLSGNRQTVSHLVAPRNLCLSLPGNSCTVLRGHLPLLDATVGTVGHFCAFSCTEVSLRQKGTPFCQLVTLSAPLLQHKA